MGLKLFNRKSYLVRPDFQLRLALTIFIFVIFYSLVFGVSIFYPLYSDMQAGASAAEQARLADITMYLHKRVWIGLVVVGFMAGVHAIFYSHRLVGPVNCFEKMVGELLIGNYSTRVKTRKRDELKELELLLNRLADVLDHIRKTDAQVHADVKKKLERVYAMLDDEERMDTDEIRRLVRSAVGELGGPPSSA